MCHSAADVSGAPGGMSARPSQVRTAYVLVEDGTLFARPVTAFASGSKDNVAWERIANIGVNHKSIAIDCGYLYAINETAGVDFQWVKNASAEQWDYLARGHVSSIAASGGHIYGVGSADGGDRIYRLVKGGEDAKGTPWERCSGGRLLSIAINDVLGYIYGIGGNDWIYRQPLREMSCDTKWQWECRAGEMTEFAMLAEGEALGVRNGRLWHVRPEGDWELEASSNTLNVNVVSVCVADRDCSIPRAPQRPPPRWTQPEQVSPAPITRGKKLTVRFHESPRERSPSVEKSRSGQSIPGSIAWAVLQETVSAEYSAKHNEPEKRTIEHVDPADFAPPQTEPEHEQEPADDGVDLGGFCHVVMRDLLLFAPGSGYMSVEVGSRIEVLYVGSDDLDSERGWLYGRSRTNREGWFPKESVEPEPMASLTTMPAKRPVMYPQAGYLRVAVGDEIQVLDATESMYEGGWLYGRVLATLREGWFSREILWEPDA